MCPNSAKVHLNTAILRRRRGDWGGALEHLDTAQTIDPSYCEADYWRGLTLLNSDRCCQPLQPIPGSQPTLTACLLNAPWFDRLCGMSMRPSLISLCSRNVRPLSESDQHKHLKA